MIINTIEQDRLKNSGITALDFLGFGASKHFCGRNELHGESGDSFPPKRPVLAGTSF
jgi:hypothetical protein